MLTPDVRPEERIQPSSVMVRSETDRAQPVRTGTQNHPTQDHNSLSRTQAGEQAAGRPEEGMLRKNTSQDPKLRLQIQAQ